MFPEVQSMLGDHAHQLDIGLEVQLRNNWRWAAVSCAIAAHYGDLSWSQESLAWRILAIDTVKANSAPPSKLLTDKKFDQQTSLEATLRYVNCLVGWSGGRPPFRRLMREIDQGRPMGVAIRWHAGTQHYVIIDGYDRTSRTISIADSQAGRDTVAYDQFPKITEPVESGWKHIGQIVLHRR
ncbi:papain-like cysteine protease family protein [Vibrio sp. PP-XX7]